MSNASTRRRPQDVAALAYEYLARNRGDAVHALHDSLRDAQCQREDARQREDRLSRWINHGDVRVKP